MTHQPHIATRPCLVPPLKTETERAELERLTRLAAPLMESIPSSLEYRLEHILLMASTIYADRAARDFQ